HFDSNPPPPDASLDAARELTEPCPPPALESLLPPAADVIPRAPAALSEATSAELAPFTPLPQIALPKPRQSDVDELLRRLAGVPLPVDDPRRSLRRLAGMDPTPPPPGTADGSDES